MLTLGLSLGWTILAALMSAAGIALVFQSWRRRRDRHAVSLWSGWGLLVLSTPIWMLAAGPDRGIAFAGLLPSVFASFVLAVQFARPDNTKPLRELRDSDRQTDGGVSMSKVLRTLYVVLLAGPVSALAALTATSLMYGGLIESGLPQPDTLLATFLALTFGWACLAIISAASWRLRWRSLVTLGCAAGFGLAAYLQIII